MASGNNRTFTLTVRLIYNWKIEILIVLRNGRSANGWRTY